jgi:cytochrome b561
VRTRFRNDSSGYGLVTKVLHWSTVAALAGQFTVGYSMHRADDLLEGAVDRWLAGEEDRLLLVHAGLGVAILALAGLRVLWRRLTPLPPWAEGLSQRERRIAHRVERALYWTLFLIPLTGLSLVLLSGEDWETGEREWAAPWELADDDVLLAAHIATQLVFFAALAAHVGLVLKHQLVDRDRLLNRML